MFPSTLSHPVTQPPSAPWPEVMAPSVGPFPLNDTPPPLPAKKHRRQQPQEQQVIRNRCSEFENLQLLQGNFFKRQGVDSFADFLFKGHLVCPEGVGSVVKFETLTFLS